MTPQTELSQLFPRIEPLEDADPELVALGERYWSLAGFDAETGLPRWSEKTSAIDTGGWGRRHYVIAAAGTRAYLDGHACPSCGGPLSLASRTSLQQVCLGEEAPPCADCTPSLAEHVRLLTDPKRTAKREATREAARKRSAYEEAHATWEQERQAAVADQYPLLFSEEAELPGLLHAAGVRELLTALALLRYAPSATPLTALTDWPDPLHPDLRTADNLIHGTRTAGLLRVHSSTPHVAFVWEPASFEEAVQEAGGDLDTLPTPALGDGYYPRRARFYAPYGTSMGTAAELMDTRLTAALAPAALTTGRQEDLLVLATELIAEEALRYFDHRLVELNLPDIPENQQNRLKDAAYRVAGARSLGQVYNLVWQATRAAAEGAQKHPRAPRANMTTHALNRFESLAQRACEESDWTPKPFSEIAGLGLAAMTRVLFYGVLDQPPLTTSLTDVSAALPPAARGTAPCPEGIDGSLALLHSHPDAWEPEETGELLRGLIELCEEDPDWHVDSEVIRRGAAQLLGLHDRLAPVLGPRHATLAALAAASLLDGRVVVQGESVACGPWIAEHFVRHLTKDLLIQQ
ncbi:hypothetical protein [Streptomyces sp. NPDC051684]|uniref:hypothetical protein n=1 Tax=Streptomyces sp. NPDC051684 TaxID=3365670 RepID=UPI0037AF05E4